MDESTWTRGWRPTQHDGVSERRHPQVVNVDEVQADALTQGQRFDGQRRRLAFNAGGQRLGASHLSVPPGKTSWPAHYHAGNEEALFILSGQGTLRLGDDRVPVRAGDWVALPAEPTAHQLLNTGTEDLVYLAVSTQDPADVVVYPDSNKIGVFGGAGPGGDPGRRFVSGFYRGDATVPYYEGEGEER
ncbi:MAG: cupin domain-containing protein [Myxococcales bacterium]|nr:cupin domain-containing protein [Myxococcales bacterium]